MILEFCPAIRTNWSPGLESSTKPELFFLVLFQREQNNGCLNLNSLTLWNSLPLDVRQVGSTDVWQKAKLSCLLLSLSLWWLVLCVDDDAADHVGFKCSHTLWTFFFQALSGSFQVETEFMFQRMRRWTETGFSVYSKRIWHVFLRLVIVLNAPNRTHDVSHYRVRIHIAEEHIQRSEKYPSIP